MGRIMTHAHCGCADGVQWPSTHAPRAPVFVMTQFQVEAAAPPSARTASKKWQVSTMLTDIHGLPVCVFVCECARACVLLPFCCKSYLKLWFLPLGCCKPISNYGFCPSVASPISNYGFCPSVASPIANCGLCP